MKNHRGTLYFALLILAYIAPLFFEFAHHDQYRHFRIPDTEKLTCDNDTQYRGLFYDLGRPVTALLECAQFMTTNRLADLTWHRVITLAVIAGLFFLLASIFRRQFKVENESSYALALAICLLPGLLDLFIMSNYAVVFGLLMAAAAFALLALGMWGYLGGFPFLLTALFTYPPSAFLFVALSCGEFLFSREKLKVAWHRLIKEFGLMMIGCGVFYAVVKIFLHPEVQYDERHVGGSYAFRVSTDYLGRASYFAEALRWALNFWNIYSLRTIATIVFFGMVWLSYRLLKKKRFDKITRTKILFAAFAPMAVFAPIGLSNMNEVLYRTIVSLTAYLLILLCWLLSSNYKEKRSYILFAAVLMTLISGFNLGMAGWNSHIEFNHLVEQIKSRGLLNNRIIFVKNVERDDSTVGMNGLPTVSDEFNINTTTYNREENTFIMRAALVEAGGDPRIHVYLCVGPDDCARAEQIIQTMPFVYVVVKQNDTKGFPPHYPIIDMEQFSR